MWGPAGVGKSALAQTCAEKVKKVEYLGAAFFFSINGCTDHKPFFVTLAYQLSTVLPDYCQALDTAVSNDKALATKKMASQFDLLIVHPLQVLERQGRVVKQMAVFIDGLDECEDTGAQEDIIRIIATSVRDKTTPFRWAIFSRAEVHILSTFEDELISPITRTVELPIRSPEDDLEIELYLRREFRNILRRRKLPLDPSWPADEDIKALVKAAAGLFAYAAAVLRFIDLSKTLRLEVPLRDVLNSIPHGSAGPFAGLDAFYTLLLKRIPEEILPRAQLLLFHIQRGVFETGDWQLFVVCNKLGLSRSEFLGVYQYLRSVLKFQENHKPLVLPSHVDSSRSLFDQNLSLQSSRTLLNQFRKVHGVINFHHKSFYDFLRDPARSSSFWVTSPTIQKRFFDSLIQIHHHFAKSYTINGNSAWFIHYIRSRTDIIIELVLASGVQSSSTSLSWPQGSEFVDSWFKLKGFYSVSALLSHDVVFKSSEEALVRSLRGLRGLDYRKSLVGEIMIYGQGQFPATYVAGSSGLVRIIDVSWFGALRSNHFAEFKPAAFLRVRPHSYKSQRLSYTLSHM
jgi:hypothetical protein